MKANLFQKIAAWIQAWQEARAERRHRRALIQEDRRQKRELRRICAKLSRIPQKPAPERPKVSSLVYNISITPPEISKSAREQIGLGRKFELVVKERKRIQDGEVVSLTLHWKSPRKPRYSFFFDICDHFPRIEALPGGAPVLPLKRDPWSPGIIPRREPLDMGKELERLREIEKSPEARAERERLANLIFEDVERCIKANAERLRYHVPGIKLPEGSK